MPVRDRLAAATVVVLVLSCAVGTPAAHGGPAYEPPVPEPPVELFRPPTTPFGPGNRGVDYETAVGAPVAAAAAGEVVFAGPVGAALHVTLLHPDGQRTSYSFLASTAVRVGQQVQGGEVVGTSSGHLHFGVRAGATYLDPLAVLAAGPPDIHLVPDPVVDPSAGVGVPVEGLALLGVVVEAATGRPGQLARHHLRELDPVVRAHRAALRAHRALLDREPCTPPTEAVAAPTERRILVLVGGFGSTSDSAAVDRVDATALGYAEGDVLRFSYAGGRTPEPRPSGALAGIPVRRYDRADSQGDLLEAAGQLRALLADVAAAEPGVPIDVVAHSQGGVVTRLALGAWPDGPPVPGEVDAVATLGSPHTGADVATAITAVHGARHGPRLLAALEARLATGLDPSAPAVAQLAETSGLLDRLGREPLPEGVRVLALGARGDLTVPAGHTAWGSAPHPVVDLTGRDAHTRLPGDAEVTRELALLLAGEPPTCEGALDHLTDAAVSEAISWVQDGLGAAAWAVASTP